MTRYAQKIAKKKYLGSPIFMRSFGQLYERGTFFLGEGIFDYFQINHSHAAGKDACREWFGGRRHPNIC